MVKMLLLVLLAATLSATECELGAECNTCYGPTLIQPITEQIEEEITIREAWVEYVVTPAVWIEKPYNYQSSPQAATMECGIVETTCGSTTELVQYSLTVPATVEEIHHPAEVVTITRYSQVTPATVTYDKIECQQ